MTGRLARRLPRHLSTAISCVILTTLAGGACSGDDSNVAGAITPPVSSLTPLITPAPSMTQTTTLTTTQPPAAPSSAVAGSTQSSILPTTTTIFAETTTTFDFVNQGASVIIANAADVPGAASKYTTALAEYGFAMLEPTNGAGAEEILEISRVYARPEAQAVAATVARLMGGLAVERMPTPAPIRDATEGLGEAGVLVMLGKDLADQPLPGPPST